MTWIIGASSFLGHGLMISDVRISFSDGTEEDLLRKAYPIAPYIIAGFAGSVYIGLKLIDSLQRALYRGDLPDDAAWQPEWVAEHWSPIAANIFQDAPPPEQENGSQILLVGVSPNENLGVPEFPRVYVTTMNWPDFMPIHAEKGLAVSHIGSGSSIERYRSGISDFFSFGSTAMMASLGGGPAAWSQMIGSSVATLVSQSPVSGISPHVFIDVLTLGSMWNGNNDRRVHHQDGRIDNFKMPRIASSYTEFAMLCRERGKGEARAVG